MGLICASFLLDQEDSFEQQFDSQDGSQSPLEDILRVKRLSDNAIVPKKFSSGAAGYDLMAACSLTIPRSSRALVKTDIAMELPRGCYGRIAPRSSLALNHHLHIGAGVVDSDYRGNVCVVVFNLSTKEDFHVEKGMRIAQLILEQYLQNIPVEETDTLEKSNRGLRGFGSTGSF